MWNPETDTLVCKCGAKFGPHDETEGATGLLKPLHNQVALESFQAQELAELFSADASARREWLTKHYGPDYPDDSEMEQLIEDFLYISHRRDGCTATFECPKCNRLALLYDVNEEWRFYAPEEQ